MCHALLMPADICEQTGPRVPEVSIVGFGQQSIFLLLPGFSSCGYSSIASLVASAMYEAAKVSTQVKSKTRHWPDFHGAMFIMYNKSI